MVRDERCWARDVMWETFSEALRLKKRADGQELSSVDVEELLTGLGCVLAELKSKIEVGNATKRDYAGRGTSSTG